MGKRIKLIDLFYYLAWCFLLVGEFYIYKNNQIRNILSVMAILFCILVIVMNKYTIKEFFYFIVFLGIAMNIKSNTNTEAVLILVIFIFASKNRIKKDLFYLIYLVQIIKFVIYIFLFTPYAYFINNLKDSSDWITANGLGLLFFEIVAIYFCYKSFKNKINVSIVERCTIIVGILIMYAYTGCKTAVICTLFLTFSDKLDYLMIIGKFIRKVRIDELPQLINILKGDMSFVGPRPERPEIAQKYEKTMPEFKYRLKVKAGLTGYAQVMGKYNTTPYDKLKLDLMYIEHQSLMLDLRIFFMTVKTCFIPEATEGVKDSAPLETHRDRIEHDNSKDEKNSEEIKL